MTFAVVFSVEAREDLRGIQDNPCKEAIIRRAYGLDSEPLAQGKPLSDDLKHYRSVRAAGQRYRIIYQVAISEGRVVVVVVGLRRAGSRHDVYKIAEKRLKGKK